MRRQEFKKRWESNDDGGGITFNDIADCAKEWGLYAFPKIQPMPTVVYRVLKAAKTNDCEEYKPEREDE